MTNLMKVSALALTVGALAACQGGGFEGTQYGEPLTMNRLTEVSAIVERPEEWVGQRVLVQGTVVDVCDHMGCWIEVVGDREQDRIRVKVDDGVIVFPAGAKGHLARVEGVVEKVTGPEVTYRIRGHGALIQGVAS